MSYRHLTVKISQLSHIRRLAVAGVSVTRASIAVGLPRTFVRDWGRRNRVRFAPRAARGTPQWLVPELARQAENALRSLLGRVA